MPAVEEMFRIGHPRLPGVRIYALDREVQAGVPQEVLVECDQDVTIPLHTHADDARMFIVSGKAKVLSAVPELNGRIVQTGDMVMFEADKPHGFESLGDGFRFLSRNGGIVDTDNKAWDITFTT